MKIFFFDFDETLYSHKLKCIPESAKTALYKLRANGDCIIIATGRGEESIPMILRELEFYPDYLIIMNGQIIFKKEEKVFERFIKLASMENIILLAQKNSIVYGGYSSDGIIIDHRNERVEAVWKEFGVPEPKVVKECKNTPLYQGHLYIRKDESYIFKEYLDNYVVNWSHPYLVNLIPNNAGKSQAVNWCIEVMGMNRKNTYAFGDGFNDKDMLLAVGHGVAMGNAQEDLKNTAEYVTDSVECDGVIKALRHYGEINSEE